MPILRGLKTYSNNLVKLYKLNLVLFVLTEFLLALTSLNPSLCLAKLPDAGEISNQLDKKSIQPDYFNHFDPPNDSPPKSALPLEKSNNPQATVKLHQIIVHCFNELEKDCEFQSITQPFLEKNLDFSQLQELTNLLNTFLKQQGWILANAYLPKQNLTEGTLHINIALGHIEKDAQGNVITIENTQPFRISKDLVESRLEESVNKAIVDSKSLERAILLLNDLPGIKAQSTFEKGKETGGSRLIINVKEGPIINGDITADNFGNTYTGLWNANINLRVNDLLGNGEQFTLGGKKGENLNQSYFAATTPIGDNGALLNIHYNYLDYRLGKELKELDIHGDTQTIGTGMSYPIIRSTELSLWGSVNYNYRTTQDLTLDKIAEQRFINQGILGLSSQYLDTIWNGAINQINYQFLFDNIEKSTTNRLPNIENDYNKHNLHLSRLQRITQDISFYNAVDIQIATKNLASIDKFYLGGVNGIRAYPTGEASGDSGWINRFELRYDMQNYFTLADLQFIVFIDTGQITLNEQRKKNDLNNAGNQNNYMLSGSGAGFNIIGRENFSINMSWAHTLGGNPGQSLLLKDSSGGRDQQRFWLTTSFYF
jgi:hemolysin activation/secretion protein